MMESKMKKVLMLRIIAILLLVTSVVIKLIQGTNNIGMLIFASVFGIIVYGMVCALSLFPADWKSKAFQPASVETLSETQRKEVERIQDKIQLKMAFGWMNIIIMLRQPQLLED